MRRCLALLFCLYAGLAAATPREIHWALIPWPPMYIVPPGRQALAVDELGQGFGDRALAEVIARLPQYRHRLIVVDAARLWGMIDRGRPVCFLGALRTPAREAKAYFSPAMIMPGLHLVVRKDKAELVPARDGVVSLQAVLAQPDLRGGLTKRRSYTTALDPLLAAPGGNARVLYQMRDNHVLRLLDEGYIDYAIEYPVIVEYLQRERVLQRPLALRPLREAPPYAVAEVACTRGEAGRQAIVDIDDALRQLAGAGQLGAYPMRWLPPDLARQLRPQAETFYRERAGQPRLRP